MLIEKERPAIVNHSVIMSLFHSIKQNVKTVVGSFQMNKHVMHAMKNRRCMHLSEQPPPQLHMDMLREHEWRQQRISALERFCLNSRPTSVPPQETSHQARECQAYQQRISELSTWRRRNEARRAAFAQAGSHNSMTGQNEERCTAHRE